MHVADMPTIPRAEFVKELAGIAPGEMKGNAVVHSEVGGSAAVELALQVAEYYTPGPTAWNYFLLWRLSRKDVGGTFRNAVRILQGKGPHHKKRYHQNPFSVLLPVRLWQRVSFLRSLLP